MTRLLLFIVATLLTFASAEAQNLTMSEEPWYKPRDKATEAKIREAKWRVVEKRQRDIPFEPELSIVHYDSLGRIIRRDETWSWVRRIVLHRYDDRDHLIKQEIYQDDTLAFYVIDGFDDRGRILAHTEFSQDTPTLIREESYSYTGDSVVIDLRTALDAFNYRVVRHFNSAGLVARSLARTRDSNTYLENSFFYHADSTTLHMSVYHVHSTHTTLYDTLGRAVRLHVADDSESAITYHRSMQEGLMKELRETRGVADQLITERAITIRDAFGNIIQEDVYRSREYGSRLVIRPESGRKFDRLPHHRPVAPWIHVSSLSIRVLETY